MIHHPTAPIPQGTCTWQSPAQPLPSSLQSGLPLTACLQLKSPSAVLEGHIYNHRIERHWPLVKHVRLFSHQYCVYDSPLANSSSTSPIETYLQVYDQTKNLFDVKFWKERGGGGFNAFHTWLPARAVKPNLLQSSRSCSSMGMRGTTIIVMDPVQNRSQSTSEIYRHLEVKGVPGAASAKFCRSPSEERT